MSKERIKQPLYQDPDAVRRLESQKYISRNLKDALESGSSNTYEWFEDNVVQKKATAEIKTAENGVESATIRMVNPDTKKEEVVYYTTDANEITRLKAISEGRSIIVEVPEEEVPETEEELY